MEATLDLPIIDAVLPVPTKSTALAKIDLKAAALSRFGEWKPAAELIVEKYKDVLFDATTPQGYKALTAAIAEVREPRFTAQRVSETSKSELAAVSKAVGAEKDAVTAFLAATEKELVAQKDAEDTRRATVAAEEKRINDERIAAHEAGIARIRSYLAAAKGLTSERIAKGIDMLTAMVFTSAEWEEFAVPAANAQCETIEALRGVYATTKAAEDAAAAAEAQRVEQARVAEEQRVEAQRLAEARTLIEADAKKQADKLAAEQAAFEKERAEWRALQKPPNLTQTLVPTADALLPISEPYVAMATFRAEDSTTTVGGSVTPPIFCADIEKFGTVVVDVKPPEASTLTTELRVLTTGALCERLGFTVKVDFLVSLGFGMVVLKGNRTATHWLENDWPRIKTALIAHIVNLA